MSKIKDIWLRYKAWIISGNTKWYKNWRIWLSVLVTFSVIKLFIPASAQSENSLNATSVDEISIEANDDSSNLESSSSEEKTSSKIEESSSSMTESESKAESESIAKAVSESESREKAHSSSVSESKAESASIANSESIAQSESIESKKQSDLDNARTDLTYDDLMRYPDDYLFETIQLSGTVIQTMQADGEVQHRVALNDNYDTVVLIGYDEDTVDGRIIDNDYITFTGSSYGTTTYETVMGAELELPVIYAERVIIN